jgi:Fe-S-cluster containining protein
MPIFHDCQRCTACCRWPGQVRVSPMEIARIAAFLQLDETNFIEQHTRLQHDRRGLALQEQPDGACVFLKDNLCAIQPVKPQQCRDFPNLWHYPGAEQYCRAIPREVSEADYVNLVATATQRSVTEVREILKRNSPDQS